MNEPAHGVRALIGDRVIVVGMTCSGKSTLAERFATAIDAPFVELDALFWLPGWVEDEDGFPRKVAAATAGERWVVAGNYFGRTSSITWPRAETVVWVDLDMPCLLWRVLRRSWGRWRSRELLWGTNTENFWTHLKLWSKDSLLYFVLTGHRRLRTRYTSAMADPQWSHIRFVRLCSPREVEEFARSVERIPFVLSLSKGERGLSRCLRTNRVSESGLGTRLVICGDSCSGKSTLAERLARTLNTPYVELDALHWRKPNWVPATDDELTAAMHDATQGERWIVAGNYLRVARDTIWPRATALIWLDLPLRIVVPRIVRRSWRRWRNHELLWGVNYEDPWQHLRLWETNRNLFTYTVTTHRRRQREFLEAMRDPRFAHLRFVRLRSTSEITAFAGQVELLATRSGTSV